MSSRRLLAGLFVLLASSAAAQQTAHIGYVYPAGGRQGSTFQVVVGGQRLAQPGGVYLTGEGVEATVLEYDRPMTQKEFNDLRDDLRSLQEKRRAATRRSQSSTNTWTAADDKKFADLRAKLLKNPPNRDGNPAIAEKVIVQVKITTNAPLGDCELRVLAATGLSNPMKFCIDNLPESTAPAGSSPNPEVDRFKRLLGIETNSTASISERRITLPVIANGQIMPGQADRFRFTARKGQHVVAQARARDLVPYLADAVPGWFQTTLALYDAKGKEVAYNDDYRFHADSVLHCEIPRDGEYVLEIKDSIYRGREDFVYRLCVGDLPFITDVFPMGGRIGETIALKLRGWNLETETLSLALPNYPTNLFLCTTNEGKLSNLIPFAVDVLPEVIEKNGSSEHNVQKVELPVIVNGTIAKPGEEDVFEFAGHAGERISIEVMARRLGSPLDSVLRLTDASGHPLASNDDFENKAEGLETHHADSFLEATLPKDGAYRVHLDDTEGRGAEDFGYRLRIGKPRPDFAVRITPSSLVCRGGLAVLATVHVFRNPGFTNLIELKDESGSLIPGGVMQPGQDRIRISLTPPKSAKGVGHLRLFAHVQTSEGELVREVVPADDMMQAFFYRHLVPAHELAVATQNSQWNTSAHIKVLSTLPLKVPMGGTARLELTVPPALFKDRFQLELNEPPAGIALSRTSSDAGSIELLLGCDAKKAKAGLKDNLIFNIVTARSTGGKSSGKKDSQGNQRFVVGCLPAIPIEIVPQQVTKNN